MSDPTPFAAHVEADPPRVVMAGELDMATSESLRAVLAPVLVDERATVVRLEVGGLTFIDSSGLAVLLEVAESGREVVLCGATEAVRRVVDVTGVGSVIRVEP